MTRRVKQRYLAIQVDSEETLDEQDLRDAVWNAVFQLFGEYGASQAGLFLIEYDKEKKQAVLRCSLKALPMVRASVTSVTKIRDKPAVLHVLRISGTIRALSKKASRLML